MIAAIFRQTPEIMSSTDFAGNATCRRQSTSKKADVVRRSVEEINVIFWSEPCF
jgi:hypothetical protein